MSSAENTGANMTTIAGLDVGGAHLKVARVEAGHVTAVEQFVCPLWQGLDKLDAALEAARPLLAGAGRHAVTMTGELSDLFSDRATGVETLVARIAREFGNGTRFWMGRRGFGAAAEAREHPEDVGSTNFLATAAFIGTRRPDALLIDLGSTTCDIIPIVSGRPIPRGLTDAERLATGELVYTGLTRTAVMGVTTRAHFQGRAQTLAREYLATMADVRRILEALPGGVDQHATADGRGKSLDESVARLARMFGRDAAEGTHGDWQVAAEEIRAAQIASIMEGCRAVLAASALPDSASVVAAGIGAGEVVEIAHALGRSAIEFGTLAEATENARIAATYSAPAVAVALLLPQAATE
jgi:probable H4MPT-linked C1 transfer pathway protein